MIYLFAAYIVGSLVLFGYLVKAAREERQDLQDRLMAMTRSEALVTHKALSEVEDDGIPSVRYVDEQRQFELQKEQV